MTRIAVIGNSHVGALKLGWDRIAASRPDLAVEFFAAPGMQFRRLAMRAPLRLGPRPSASEAQIRRLMQINGRTEIDLAGFDVVVLAGRTGGLGLAAELLARHDVDGLPEAGAGIAPHRLSAAAFDAFCRSAAETAGREEAPWRNWTRPRLFLLPRTRPSEVALRGTLTPAGRIWRRLARTPDKLEAGLGRYLDQLEQVLAADGIGLLRQPAGSIAPSGLTREDMTRGSMRIDGDVGHGEEDATHANAEYGRLAWESFAARLTAETAPA